MDRFVAAQIKRLEAGKKPYLTRKEKLQIKIEETRASYEAQLADLDAKIKAFARRWELSALGDYFEVVEYLNLHFLWIP